MTSNFEQQIEKILYKVEQIFQIVNTVSTNLSNHIKSPTPGVSNLAVVTSVSATTGAKAGGQTFTVTGTNFTGATGVTVGTVPGTNVSVVNSTTITFTNTAQAAGTYSVQVVNAAGTSVVNTNAQIVLS